MRSRLHSRLAAVLILGFSAHGADAESPVSAGLTEQALHRLSGETQALPKRTFLRTVFRSTIEASIRQPITTYRLGKAICRQRGMALLEDNLPVRVSLAFADAAPPPPGSPEFEARLDQLGLAAPLPGELSYLLDGGMFFSAFEKALATAKQSIDVQVFIFDSDDVGLHCADLLRARAEEIPVRVILDDLGSTFAHSRQPPSGLPAGFKQPGDIGDYLRHGGSKVALRETLNPWLVTDHTKLHLFDRKVAFIGGMNLGRESRHEWHDLMVSVRGPIVAALNRDFEGTWKRNGPRGDLTLFSREEPPKTAEGPGVPIRILRTDAVNARSDILLAMLQAIRGACERIWIEMPYFAADIIENELEAAATRGVDVRVILPNRANHGIMDAGNFVTARNLLKAGVKVYHFPGMTHLKAMICDDWATVGSANLDTLSLRINRELNLSFSDPALVGELVSLVFEPDFQASRPLTITDTKLPLASLIESIADQL